MPDSVNPQLLAAVAALPAGTSAADALTAVNAPVMTPRTIRIDYTEMASLWGATRTVVFMAALAAASKQTDNPALAGLATLTNTLLAGPGVNPADPQTTSSVGLLVTAGLCTADEVAALLSTVSYPAGGNGTYTLDDVTAAQQQIATAAGLAKVAAVLASTLNDWLPQQASVPTAAAVVQQLTTALSVAGVV